MEFNNKAELKEYMANNNLNFVIKEQENEEEYREFYFIGNYQGKEVAVDAALYTLRLYYESEIYDQAEQEVANKYPEFAKIVKKGVDLDTADISDEKKEEISFMLAEYMDELEEEGTLKVNEFVEVEEDQDEFITVEGALHRPAISDNLIEEFINNFNNAHGDSEGMKLDKTAYTFEEE